MMCMTELHGDVCHRTSTPHKSGNKMKEKKKYALPPYCKQCKAPTRPLKSHHLHSYQTTRAMHDHYLYSYLPRTLRDWSILPVQIAYAPSLECFKSRIVTAFGTGTIIIMPPISIGRSTGAATAARPAAVRVQGKSCLHPHIIITIIQIKS